MGHFLKTLMGGSFIGVATTGATGRCSGERGDHREPEAGCVRGGSGGNGGFKWAARGVPGADVREQRQLGAGGATFCKRDPRVLMWLEDTEQ